MLDASARLKKSVSVGSAIPDVYLVQKKICGTFKMRLEEEGN